MLSSTACLLIGSLGTPEILIIICVAVILFGGKKIPELAKGLGEGIRNFKTTMKEEEPKVEEKKQV
jgi:sec-independent protein translocase protein TatA